MGLLVSFLPWYGADVPAPGGAQHLQENGWHGWHGWALLAVFLFLLILELLLLEPLLGRSLAQLVPALPAGCTEPRLLIGGALSAAAAILLYMGTEGGGVSGSGVSAGATFGAWLGLLCALTIAAGGLLLRRDAAQR